MNIPQRIHELYWLCMENKASEAERKELLEYITLHENKSVAEALLELPVTGIEYEALDNSAIDSIIHTITAAANTTTTVRKHQPYKIMHRMHFIKYRRWLVASVLIISLLTGFYLLLPKKNPPAAPVVKKIETIQPGKNGAVLTLADGSQVVLDSANNGVIARQGGVTAKILNGQLVYEGQGNSMQYNTMSTPNGRQFHLTLPDGSGVWLNCASSIKFPVAFGKERKVEITGEAYFEIAKNIASPFIVQLPNQSSVTVLGTSFNINMYEDEPVVSTTLFEGVVQYNNTGREQKLRPGQQLLENKNSTTKIHMLGDDDLEEVVAWKNGYFNISGNNFSTLLRQLSRWYDIEITAEKNLPQKTFSASISKKIPLSSFLKALEVYGVSWKTEQGKVIIKY